MVLKVLSASMDVWEVIGIGMIKMIGDLRTEKIEM